MPYTFRNENEFLPARAGGAGGPGAPADTYGDAFGEYQQYVALGVDAVFSDDPDTALRRTPGPDLRARAAGRCSTSATSRPARTSASPAWPVSSWCFEACRYGLESQQRDVAAVEALAQVRPRRRSPRPGSPGRSASRRSTRHGASAAGSVATPSAPMVRRCSQAPTPDRVYWPDVPRVIVSSRPGPTPIAETGAPESCSIRST